MGEVLNKDKSDDSVTVTIRFRNGPPNARIGVQWQSLNTPGDCADEGPLVDTGLRFSTDANGAARERIRLFQGNPFPGTGAKLRMCVLAGGGCVLGSTAYIALFPNVVYPPGP